MKLIKLIESVYKLVDELKLTAKLYFSKCTCSTNLLFLAGTKHPCCDHDFDSHVHTYIENLADNGLSQDEGGSISHCQHGVRYREVPLPSATSVPCQPIQCWLNNLFCRPVSQAMKVKFFLPLDHVLPPLGTYTLFLIARCP